MKKLLALLFAVAAIPLFAADFYDDEVRQAVYNALDQARPVLKSAPFGTRTVAVLPFRGDKSELFVGKLKNMLTECGFKCVEGKEDPMWNEIIREIAWDERKDDILDPATLIKFGKLKAAQILLYGRVVALDRNDERVYVEIELHAADLKTKRHIWGGTFAARFYRNKDIQGIVVLDDGLKSLLKENFAEVGKSLQSREFSGKLAGIRSVAVIPLAADIDEYITGLAIEALAATSHQPMRPDIPSLTQLRLLARSDKMPADGVLHGAVRDLRRTNHPAVAVDEKTMRESCTVHAEIQLFLEDPKDGMILWSKTVTIAKTFSCDRPMTPEELEAARKATRKNFLYQIEDIFLDHWGKILCGIIVIAVLFFLGAAVMAWLKNRTVR
jgi:hypothetical protein